MESFATQSDLPLLTKHTPADTSASQHAAPIPVLSTTVVKDDHLLLLRLFFSLDHPIDKIVLTAARGNAIVHAETLFLKLHLNKRLQLMEREFVGCVDGWNAALRLHPTAPYYIMVGYDVMFLPSQLGMLAYTFALDQATDQAHILAANVGPSCGDEKYNVFALRSSLVQRAGLFDENLWPGYWEDNDWQVGIRSSTAGPC